MGCALRTQLPELLNGSPVVEYAEHKSVVTVMVKLDHNPHTPFVVATWTPECVDTWTWGHYCFDKEEADRKMIEVRKRNDKRS